jgi:hypothetical protein
MSTRVVTSDAGTAPQQYYFGRGLSSENKVTLNDSEEAAHGACRRLKEHTQWRLKFKKEVERFGMARAGVEPEMFCINLLDKLSKCRYRNRSATKPSGYHFRYSLTSELN